MGVRCGLVQRGRPRIELCGKPRIGARRATPDATSHLATTTVRIMFEARW